MTRLELLRILVGQARSNGFEFRRWYTTRLSLPWESADAAFRRLDSHLHYYALLFSPEFAEAFWKSGRDITFQMPANSFQRRLADGSIGTVQRKSFIRRSARRDAWRYHLREMALADEPLRYMRKYLRVDEEISDEAIATGESAPPPKTTPPQSSLDNKKSATLALALKAAARREAMRRDAIRQREAVSKREAVVLEKLLRNPPPLSPSGEPVKPRAKRKPRLPGSP